MGIEYFFLAVVIVCGLIAAIGAALPGVNQKPRREAASYEKIYRDITPREL